MNLIQTPRRSPLFCAALKTLAVIGIITLVAGIGGWAIANGHYLILMGMFAVPVVFLIFLVCLMSCDGA